MDTPPARKNAKRDFDNVLKSPDFNQKLAETTNKLTTLVNNTYESFTLEMKKIIGEMNERSLSNFKVVKELLFDEIKKLMASISKLEEENIKNACTITSLSSAQNNLALRFNHLEQEKLNNSIEITGISPAVMNSEKPANEIASQILTIYDVQKYKSAYKRQVNTKSEPINLLIVTFDSYEDKMCALNKKRNAAGGRKCTVYFNHSLTSLNRSIFMRARIAARSLNLKTAIKKPHHIRI